MEESSPKIQFIPKGFDKFEWEFDTDIPCRGQNVCIESFISKVLGKKCKISFTKKDLSELDEVEQSYVKLVGEQGWCIKGRYYMLYFIALEWLEKKIQDPTQQEKLKNFASTHDFQKATSLAVIDFLKVNIRMQWDNFLSAIRDANSSGVKNKNILEDIFEGNKDFVQYTEKEVRDYILNKIHGKIRAKS